MVTDVGERLSVRLYVRRTQEWMYGSLHVTNDMPDPADGGLADRADSALGGELGVASRWL